LLRWNTCRKKKKRHALASAVQRKKKKEERRLATDPGRSNLISGQVFTYTGGGKGGRKGGRKGKKSESDARARSGKRERGLEPKAEQENFSKGRLRSDPRRGKKRLRVATDLAERERSKL